MKKFKYQMLRIYGVDPSKHERALNETGEDGWELVSVLLRKDDVGSEYAVYYLGVAGAEGFLLELLVWYDSRGLL